MTDPTNLYERMGGDAGVTAVVEDFYARVLPDPELGPFFAHTDMATLARMQHEFFTAALGGPGDYSGMDLVDVHAGRGIQPAHVARFLDHLVEVLRDRGLDDDDVDAVAARLAISAQDITGSTSEDG